MPSLLRALKNPKASVRAGVTEALGYVRPKDPKIVPVLIETLTDPQANVREAAVWSLSDFGHSAEKAIPSLISLLGDPDDGVRRAAITALIQLKSKSQAAIPALVENLKDNNEWVRRMAAAALGELGASAKSAVPGLIDALKTKKYADDHYAFAEALGRIGPEAKDAVPALIEPLRDKNDQARRNAAIALGRIGLATKPAVSGLIAALKDKKNRVGEAAAGALGQLGPDAKAAVPDLIAAAKEWKGGRASAIWALGAIGPDAKAAVPLLTKLLADEGPYLYFRVFVAEALADIGPPAKTAVPALGKLARDLIVEELVRRAAADAVMRLDPKFGAKHNMETAWLNVRLGKISPINLAPRQPITEKRKRHIKKLIAQLAEVKDPYFGMSATLTGRAFAPVPDRESFELGLLTDHQLKSSAPFRRLVEIGPEALPFLLEALDDKTPTQLKIDLSGIPGFSAEMSSNPLNPLERRVLSKEVKFEGDHADEPKSPYPLKVGDVCFVAIGQIVGRHYLAVRYQPTAFVIINSPVATKGLRERVRQIWQSKDPARKLLDSLLLDYATEGLFNGESLDGWYEGSNLQIEAAMRLLYYFPKETAPLIAARLRSFDVRNAEGDEWTKREVKNGARTVDFLKAVSWCDAPPIKKALADIGKRTNDPEIKATLRRE